MERKRRDHIKDSFTALRDAVPSLQGEKVVSVSSFPIHFIHFLPCSFCLLILFKLIRGFCFGFSYCLFLFVFFFFLSVFFPAHHFILFASRYRRVEHKFWKKPPNTLHSWSEKIKPINRATMIWNGKTINWISKVSRLILKKLDPECVGVAKQILIVASRVLFFALSYFFLSKCSSTAWTSIECCWWKWIGWFAKWSTFIGIGYVWYWWWWFTSGYCYNAVISTECEKNQNHIQCKSHVSMKLYLYVLFFFKCYYINVANVFCVCVCMCPTTDGCVCVLVWWRMQVQTRALNETNQYLKFCF